MDSCGNSVRKNRNYNATMIPSTAREINPIFQLLLMKIFIASSHQRRRDQVSLPSSEVRSFGLLLLLVGEEKHMVVLKVAVTCSISSSIGFSIRSLAIALPPLAL